MGRYKSKDLSVKAKDSEGGHLRLYILTMVFYIVPGRKSRMFFFDSFYIGL